MECPICLTIIGEDEYAIIDNTAETGHYHINCLNQWTKTSNHGILSQFPIETYTIYNNDNIVKTVNVNTIYNSISIYFNNLEDNLTNIGINYMTEEEEEENENNTETEENLFDICCLCTIL